MTKDTVKCPTCGGPCKHIDEWEEKGRMYYRSIHEPEETPLAVAQWAAKRIAELETENEKLRDEIWSKERRAVVEAARRVRTTAGTAHRKAFADMSVAIDALDKQTKESE
jgi:hypothetical protein